MSTHPAITKAEAYRLRRDGIIKTAMPPRLPDDVLREDLAQLVTQANEEADPMQRAILIGKAQSVRRLLGIGEPATQFNKRETR